MFFQDMALRFSVMLAEDALLFGLSEEKEAALKDLSKELIERGIEIPYVVKKVLGWIHEEEPQEVLDRSGVFSYELSSVSARMAFKLQIDTQRIKMPEGFIRSELESRLNGTGWEVQEVCNADEISVPDNAFSSLKNLAKRVRHRHFKIEIIANFFESIEEDTEEAIIERLIEFREEEFEKLKEIFGDSLSIEILSKDSDIVVVNE